MNRRPLAWLSSPFVDDDDDDATIGCDGTTARCLLLRWRVPLSRSFRRLGSPPRLYSLAETSDDPEELVYPNSACVCLRARARARLDVARPRARDRVPRPAVSTVKFRARLAPGIGPSKLRVLFSIDITHSGVGRDCDCVDVLKRWHHGESASRDVVSFREFAIRLSSA